MSEVIHVLNRLWQGFVLRRMVRSLAAFATHRCRISPGVIILGNGSIKHGRSVGIGTRSVIQNDGHIELGKGVWLSTDVNIETSGHIVIGDGTTIQRRCTLNGNVKIGKECIFAPNVFVSSGTHPFRADPSLSIRAQERAIAAGMLQPDTLDRPVVIGDDCWIGINVVIMPGVTIGNGAVIGANAVVVGDVKGRTVVGGIPARQISVR